MISLIPAPHKMLIRPAECFVILLVLIVCTGCSDATPDDVVEDEPDTSVDAGDTADGESGDVADVDADVADVDANEDEEREPMGPDEFEKPPEEPRHEESQIEYDESNDQGFDQEQSDSGGHAAFVARPHMRFSEYSDENWIYADEYLIFDGRLYRYGEYHLPADYEIFVTHEGERLPMRFIEVTEEGGFPSVEEVEQWSKDDFAYGHVIDLDNNEMLHYSIVIPPWAFPEKAAYNIQLMFHPFHQSNSDVHVHQHLFQQNRLMTAYVGSELYESEGEEIEDRQNDDTVVEHPVIGGYHGLSLYPDEGIYDWKSYSDSTELKLAEPVEVSDDTVTVNLHQHGVERSILHVLTDYGTNLYYVIQDGEIVDTFLYEIPDLGDDEYSMLPIDIEMPDSGKTQVGVTVIPLPFEPFHEGVYSTDGGTGSIPPRPISSNFLLFEREEDD